MRDRDSFINYAAIWADCADYGFGIEEVIKNNSIGAFGQELFRSGNQQLKATVTLLHEDIPNPKSMESARILSSRAGRSRQKQVAMIVHCGLPQDSFEALVPCAPNYCARKIWKKLSISVVGVKKKLRRLSTVGAR